MEAHTFSAPYEDTFRRVRVKALDGTGRFAWVECIRSTYQDGSEFFDGWVTFFDSQAEAESAYKFAYTEEAFEAAVRAVEKTYAKDLT